MTDKTEKKLIDKITVKQLAELAQHAESVDPIDWGMLNISEDEAYLLMASQVLETFLKTPEDQRLVIALSSLTKLTVENFVLNLRLHGKG